MCKINSLAWWESSFFYHVNVTVNAMVNVNVNVKEKNTNVKCFMDEYSEIKKHLTWLKTKSIGKTGFF